MAGEQWECAACGKKNRASRTACRACGGRLSLDEARDREKRRRRIRYAGVALTGALALYFAFGDMIADELSPERKLHVTVSLSPDCSDAVSVSVENGSTRIVKSMRVHVALFTSGVSKPRVEGDAEWTSVVRPGEKQTQCIYETTTHDSLSPHRSEQPVVHGRLSSAQFYGDGEFVP